MPDTIPEWITTVIESNAFSGFACLLIGLIAGQRLQLYLSRRTEYNELADSLFLAVDKIVDSYDGHHFCLPDDQVKMFQRRMSSSHRRRFDQAIAAYEVAAKQTYTDEHGHVHFSNPETVNAALKDIANLLRRH